MLFWDNVLGTVKNAFTFIKHNFTIYVFIILYMLTKHLLLFLVHGD